MAYGVGPRTICPLRQYWGRLAMVVRAEVYYGAPFKIFREVTLGGLLSTTISNVVVYGVLQH